MVALPRRVEMLSALNRIPSTLENGILKLIASLILCYLVSVVLVRKASNILLIGLNTYFDLLRFLWILS